MKSFSIFIHALFLSLFLLLLFSSCNRPLFKSTFECYRYIQSNHTSMSSCPANAEIKNKAIKWDAGDLSLAKIFNGTLKVEILSFEDDEVEYQLNYKYFIDDKYSGFGGIIYTRDLHYDVTRQYKITRDPNKRKSLLTTFVSGHVHEYANAAGYSRKINNSWDE